MFQTFNNITILFNSVEHFFLSVLYIKTENQKTKNRLLVHDGSPIGPKTAVQDKVECIKIMITNIQGSLLMH